MALQLAYLVALAQFSDSAIISRQSYRSMPGLTTADRWTLLVPWLQVQDDCQAVRTVQGSLQQVHLYPGISEKASLHTVNVCTLCSRPFSAKL